MKSFVYQQLAALEDNNWWFRGRRKIILSFLDYYFKDRTELKILDVGCGAGSVMKLLSLYGQVTGLENHKSLVEQCRRGGKNVVFGDVVNLNFSTNCFDLVVVLEVLEHVEDDLKALRELYRVLKKGGLLFLSVPAFPFLWGNQDLAAGHKRRYKKSELTKLLIKSNFSIMKITYLNFFLFPFISFFRVARKTVSRQKPQLDSDYFSKTPWIGSILAFILGTEAFLFTRFNFPFGVTLLCVAKK